MTNEAYSRRLKYDSDTSWKKWDLFSSKSITYDTNTYEINAQQLHGRKSRFHVKLNTAVSLRFDKTTLCTYSVYIHFISCPAPHPDEAAVVRPSNSMVYCICLPIAVISLQGYIIELLLGNYVGVSSVHNEPCNPGLGSAQHDEQSSEN